VPWARVLIIILCACSACYLVAYLALACIRMPYPYELEWMEGGVLDGVGRVLSGKPLYVEPSLEFTPFGYSPLFFYVGAVISKAFGSGFLPLRLVSFSASLGFLVVLLDFVRRDTGSLVAGIVAAGLFLATYRIGGAWLDIARVDSLFLFLLLMSISALRFRRSVGALALSGLLAFLSFMTKQAALPVLIAMTVYGLICLPRWRRIVFPAVVALLFLLSTLLLQERTGGWYWYYVFHLPNQQIAPGAGTLSFWLHDMSRLSIALVVCLFSELARPPAGRTTASGCSLLFLVGMVGASWYSRLIPASYENVLLPAYAAISISFGRGMAVLTPEALATASTMRAGHRHARVGVHEPFVLVLCALQFLSLRYDPIAQLPTARDRRAGDALASMVRDQNGEVLLPSIGYLATRAGKRPSAHLLALAAVLWSRDEGVKAALRDQIVRTLDGGNYRVLILDREPSGLEFDIRRRYTFRGNVFEEQDVFWPVTGLRTRPELIYELSE